MWLCSKDGCQGRPYTNLVWCSPRWFPKHPTLTWYGVVQKNAKEAPHKHGGLKEDGYDLVERNWTSLNRPWVCFHPLQEEKSVNREEVTESPNDFIDCYKIASESHTERTRNILGSTSKVFAQLRWFHYVTMQGQCTIPLYKDNRAPKLGLCTSRKAILCPNKP